MTEELKINIEDYEKAAEMGNCDAMNQLGIIYKEGKHVDKDYIKALKYIRMSINKGNINGLKILGDMYFYAKGFRKGWKSYKNAFDCYMKIVNEGELSTEKNIDEIISHAYCQLGDMYRSGKGIGLNNIKTNEYHENIINCYKKAIDRGNIIAMKKIGDYYYKKENGHDAQKYYVMYLEKINNDNDVLNKLSLIYMYGLNVKKNLILSFNLSQKIGNIPRSKLILETIVKEDIQDPLDFTKILINIDIEKDDFDDETFITLKNLKNIINHYSNETSKLLLMSKKIPIDVIDSEIFSKI